MENTDNYTIVNSKYVKNAIHMFCAVVEDISKNKHCGIEESCYFVEHELKRYSERNTKICEYRPIEQEEDILSSFFNQQNCIPLYIFYWLCSWSDMDINKVKDFSHRYYDTYQKLQQKYVERYRAGKQDEKDYRNCRKQVRRQLCQLYKSGKYSAVFKLYGKPLSNVIDVSSKNLDDIYTLLTEFFYEDFNTFAEQDIAVAYLIGLQQGACKNSI